MALFMTSGPETEPVTLAEAKAIARIDTSTEDALIQSLILTSRLHIEAALGLALITQSWRLVLDVSPDDDVLDLPIRPVQSIGALRVFAADGTTATVDTSNYRLDAASTPPRFVWRAGAWPRPGRARGGIEIDLTCGYGADSASIPEPIRHAHLMLIAHWYEHRDPIEIGSAAARIPDAVSHLLQPYRIKRL